MQRRTCLAAVGAAGSAMLTPGCAGVLGTPADGAAPESSPTGWPTYRRNPGRTGHAPWATIPDAPYRAWTYEPKRRVFASPVVADGTVYVADPWNVHALDRAGGAEQWRHHVRDRTDFPCVVEGAPAVTGAGVLVGTCDGVHLLDAADGTARWRTATVRDGAVRPAVAGGRGYLAANAPAGPALLAVDPADGSVDTVLQPDVGTLTTPAVADDRLYAALSGELGEGDDEVGRVYAVDRDGAVRWTHTLDGATVYATPAVADGTVYVAGGRRGGAGRVVALDAEDGSEQWTRETASVVEIPVAVTSAVVYVAADAGRLHALDAATGRERWTYDLVDRAATGPVAARDGVCVTSADGTLHAVDADGEGRWTAALGPAAFYADPVLTGDRVLAGGRALAAFGPS